jgi:stage II sporulation protein D (peptidoglycan lytic transglycosylase)
MPTRAVLSLPLIVALLLAAVPASAAGPVRVALLAGLKIVDVTGPPMAVSDVAGQLIGEAGATAVRVVQKGPGVEVRGRALEAVRLVPMLGGGLRFGSREYPGVIEVIGQPDGMIVVNELPLEEYVAGVVKAEAGDAMPLEMLKAQAVVARTYAAYHRDLFAGRLYHLAASTAHQQYRGRVGSESPSWAAVRETDGLVMRWDGEVFPAFYHTDSGGHTEDSRAVFGTAGVPPIRAVPVGLHAGSPHQEWRLELPLAQLSALLARQGLTVGRVVGLDVVERSASRRVSLIAVRGAAGSATLKGHEFRRLVGNDTLKSTMFNVTISGPVARFAGRGYGHGVGLDQWGARAMAEQGWRAPEILQHFYRGAALSSLEPRAESRR